VLRVIPVRSEHARWVTEADRFNRFQFEVRRAHMVFSFAKNTRTAAVVVANFLELWHVGRAITTYAVASVVQMILQLLLVARFIRDVRHTRRLHTLLRLLLVQILERVLVEVDGLGAVA